MKTLLGSTCVLLSCVALILQKKKDNQRRNHAMEDLIFAFRRMSEEIRMIQPPLAKLLKRLALDTHQDVADFFDAVSTAAGQGQAVSQVWIEETKKLPISKKEQDIVLRVNAVLHDDEDGICRGMNLAAQELEAKLKEWDKRRIDEEKRMAAVYLTCAALFVILLI